jgi:SAM-dependent methyltransferase
MRANTDAPPAADHAGATYWKNIDGAKYQEMIRQREGAGNAAYGQQERFLTALMLAEQERLGRPLEVLEFGCGFGRHAAYLANLPGVRYHGYEFSANMIAPLKAHPPASLAPVEERLFVGPRLPEAAGARTFDVVFTVSVLIHNPSEAVPGLIDDMRRMLKPDGLLVLVENQAVPFHVFDSAWHDGCWLHAYADLAGPGWDLHFNHGLIDTHDLYVLRWTGVAEQRIFRLDGAGDVRDTSRPLARAALDETGMQRLRTWAGQASAALMSGGAEGARTTELEEQLRVERALFSRRQHLLALSDRIAEVRAEARPPATALAPAPVAASEKPGVLVDDPLDTNWSHADPRFRRVVHLFHQEWHGIRAAAGYFPGHKVAITCARPLTPDELKRTVEACTGGLLQAVVVHAWSPNMRDLVHLLRHEAGSALRLCAVWHGSSAQFHFDPEWEFFAELLELRARGVLDGVACVKPDLHLLDARLHPRPLLNLPPRLPAPPSPPSGGLKQRAFIPMPNDWRKNFYTNLYAACGVERLRDLYVTARFLHGPSLTPGRRVVSLAPPPRAPLFRLVADMDLVLNASLSECQPMTALEAMALGVPCLTGPLSLGALDEHPYQKLAQVPGVDSVGALRAAIERVLDLAEQRPAELRAMMADFLAALAPQALDRLGELVHA